MHFINKPWKVPQYIDAAEITSLNICKSLSKSVLHLIRQPAFDLAVSRGIDGLEPFRCAIWICKSTM